MSTIAEGITLFAVGQEYPLKRQTANPEIGAALDAFDDNGGFYLTLYLPDVREDEVELFHNAKMSIRTIREAGFVLAMVRFGNTPMVFELAFDPTLYKDGRAFQFENQNVLRIFLVDSRTSIIKAMRIVTVPSQLREIWVNDWEKAFDIPDFSIKYKQWVADLDGRYPVLKLWEYARYVGKFGDI